MIPRHRCQGLTFHCHCHFQFKHVLSILERESNSYPHFHASLIVLLSAGSRCDVLKRQKFVNLSDAKIVRCLFGLVWRLVASLPPPVSFLCKMQKSQNIELKVNCVRIL